MTAIASCERLENPFARKASPRASDARPSLALRPMTGYEEELVEERRDEANTAVLCNELLARCLVPPGADATAARARVRALSTRPTAPSARAGTPGGPSSRGTR